jgi:hypothetical protein
MPYSGRDLDNALCPSVYGRWLISGAPVCQRDGFQARVVAARLPLTPLAPTLIALSIFAVLVFVLYLRNRGRRSARQDSERELKPQKFDTTLGDLHDMREALRPLEHTRAASRRDPRDRP